MNENVVARAVARIDAWIGLYTRGLPPAVAQERRDEVLADIRDQTEWARSREIPAPRIARALLSRALRGSPADITWAAGLAPSGRALDRALVCLFAALTLMLIVVGVVALIRQPPDSIGGSALAVVLGILLGVGALALLARRRTRWLSGLWVTASAHVTLFDGIDYVADSTTILRSVVNAAPAWRTSLLVADIGIVLVCLAAAVWWTRPGVNFEGHHG